MRKIQDKVHLELWLEIEWERCGGDWMQSVVGIFFRGPWSGSMPNQSIMSTTQNQNFGCTWRGGESPQWMVTTWQWLSSTLESVSMFGQTDITPWWFYRQMEEGDNGRFGLAFLLTIAWWRTLLRVGCWSG